MSDAQQDQKPAGTVTELEREIAALRAEIEKLTADNAGLKREINRAKFGGRGR
jgi:cell division protein FtsB